MVFRAFAIEPLIGPIRATFRAGATVGTVGTFGSNVRLGERAALMVLRAFATESLIGPIRATLRAGAWVGTFGLLG